MPRRKSLLANVYLSLFGLALLAWVVWTLGPEPWRALARWLTYRL